MGHPDCRLAGADRYGLAGRLELRVAPRMTTNRVDSVLAHVAGRLTGQTETLATEALGYILSRSAASRQALRETLRTGGVDVPPLVQIGTEVQGKHDERVDVVGFDQSGAERVLIEVKFWAGLTEHQPNTYLRRLPKDGEPAVLLFVAPEQRLTTLWAELCRKAEGQFDLRAETTPEALEAVTIKDQRHRMMLTSWRTLLNAMASRAGTDGDLSAQRDILQLDALCEREDSEAFLPLRSEEFAPAFPRRMMGLRTLIDDTTARGCTDGFVSTEGVRVVPQVYGYGRWIWLGKNADGWLTNPWFGVHHKLWARRKETPLWLVFYRESGDLAQKKLRDRVYGFTLPTGVEYDAVLDSVVEELRQIGDALGS